MPRTMALCRLTLTNRATGASTGTSTAPYKLIMIAGGDKQAPLPGTHLDYCWLGVSTEAVKTRSRELVLGRYLLKFMRRTLGINSTSGGVRGEQTWLRNQMRRLFNAHLQLVYGDNHGEARVSGGAPGAGSSRSRIGKR